MTPDLIDKLLRSGDWSHEAENPVLRETHISWVILVGEYAYKIKKPVQFGFVDFSTVARRERDCRRELELNAAFSPTLYIDVVEIRERDDGTIAASGGDEGRVIDYAVRMRRFPEQAMYSRMLARGTLQVGHLERLAELLAAIHNTAPGAGPASRYGSALQIRFWSDENLSQIEAIVDNAGMSRRLKALIAAIGDQLRRLGDRFDERRAAGRVRDCHGDLHLSNVLWLDGSPCLFDRIEFNDELRWIDVMNDTAFVIMDLVHENREAFAWAFLNRYLRRTGDYAGLAVLPFYICYRALVRAKVSLLGCGDAAAAASGDTPGFRSHLEIAECFVARRRPTLTITCGLSGSGKSTQALRRALATGAIVVHSDVERKRLFGLDELDRSESGLHDGIYAPEATRRVYTTLAELASVVIEAGFPVIVDAAFLKRTDRERFRTLADSLSVEFFLLYCDAPVDVLRRRIIDRMEKGSVSEADIAVLEQQMASAELPDRDEIAKYGINPDGFAPASSA